jgi:hypothetical protein
MTRAEAERDAIARIPAEDPDLQEMRDAVSSSLGALGQAMGVLDRFLAEPEGDDALISGPGGFNQSRAQSDQELARFQARRQAFLDRFQLSVDPPPPNPDRAPNELPGDHDPGLDPRRDG